MRATTAQLDYLSYELGRFCTMMITGNPIALEILALMVHEERRRRMVRLAFEEEWDRLLNYLTVRRALITKELIDNYVNYAKSQFNQARRLAESGGSYGERSCKSMYHGVRVLLEAIELLNGSLLPRMLHSTEHRRVMREIKDRVMDQQGAESYYGTLEKRALEMKSEVSNIYHSLPSVVTEQTKQFIQRWMVSLRIRSEDDINQLLVYESESSE